MLALQIETASYHSLKPIEKPIRKRFKIMKEIMLLSKIVSNTQLSRKVFLYTHCQPMPILFTNLCSIGNFTNFPTILFIVDVCKVA